jgi:predicted DsbA family dithiol-disulfide isomerase
MGGNNLIQLDIISDVACPWCYIGKGYLDRALESRPDHPFLVEWHPFQLNPDLPPEGMDRMEYMTAKFGSRENVMRMHEPLLAHAEKAGVEFDLPAIRRAPNTLDAHRLIHWAGLEGRQTPVVSALMKAYWRDGRDIGDAEVLAEIAGEQGLDRAMTERLLAGDADRDAIRARVRHSQDRGVHSVPTFILGNRHALQGAQPVEAWLRVINELTESMKENE